MGPYEEIELDPFETRYARSPHAQEPYDARSIASGNNDKASEFINFGPLPAADAPASRPVLLPSAARFNRSQGHSSLGNTKGPTQRLFPNTHIGGRAMTLSGAEALTAGILRNQQSATIAGGILLATGVLSALAAITVLQKTLHASDGRTAHVISMANLAGLAALGGGGFLRQYALHHHNNALNITAMVSLGVGIAEAALCGGMTLAFSERVASTMPTKARSRAALWIIDAGVVTTLSYGLATRLNAFSYIVDEVVLGIAYTATLGGIVWQYADGAWFKRSNVAITPHLATTWKPTAMVSLAFVSKIGVLAAMKFAVDGVLLSNASYIIGGVSGSFLCFASVILPQIFYFHNDIKASGHAQPYVVTAAVIVGAMLLAVGAGLREWAAFNHRLPLARGAMALAGLGALTVVTCSSYALAASELTRGRAPMRFRPEVALALQTTGLAIGVAYCLGIRQSFYSAVIDDVMLSASYLLTGIGAAMTYASSQLDRASLISVQAEFDGSAVPANSHALEHLG